MKKQKTETESTFKHFEVSRDLPRFLEMMNQGLDVVKARFCNNLKNKTSTWERENFVNSEIEQVISDRKAETHVSRKMRLWHWMKVTNDDLNQIDHPSAEWILKWDTGLYFEEFMYGHAFMVNGSEPIEGFDWVDEPDIIPAFVDGMVNYQYEKFLRDWIEKESSATLNFERFEWLGNVEQFGFIFNELVEKGYLKFPDNNRSSYPKFAKKCMEVFKITVKEDAETSHSNLSRALNPKNNSLAPSAKKALTLPHQHNL